MKHFLTTLSLCATASYVFAGDVQIVSVDSRNSGSSWTFDVTLEHGDTGWDHYADGWGVYAPDGTELGYRVLAHPHVNEQPFRRSLSGVVIPEDITEVIIKTSVNSHSSETELTVPLN
jgi:hypothetical protein